MRKSDLERLERKIGGNEAVFEAEWGRYVDILYHCQDGDKSREEITRDIKLWLMRGVKHENAS